MVTGILYGEDIQALNAMGQLLREGVRRLAGDECRLAICEDMVALAGAADVCPRWDIACVDIGDAAHLEMVHEVRKYCGQADLLLVVDANVSPMKYIRPGVMPTGLVQRPLAVTSVRGVVEEFVRHLVWNRSTQQDMEGFLIEGKGEVLRIPFSQIVCFESRLKRITVRTSRHEYAYYDTLDSLQDRLPDSFMRCHRSYIVNVTRVRQFNVSHNSIEMDDGSQIPVSRSFKAIVKERLT